MRIALVIPSYFPLWGGAENQARTQAREYVKRGHEVEIVTWKRDPSLPGQESLDGALVHRVDRWRPGPWANLRAFVSLAQLLVSVARRADVVAAHHLLSTAYLAGFVAWVIRRPIVSLPVAGADQPGTELRLMAGSGPDGRLRRLLALPLRRGVTVALSSWIANDLRQLGFQHVVHIPNGVEDRGLPDGARLRVELYEPLGVPPGARVVVAAGRFIHPKGLDVLISAWPEIVAAERHAHLVLVGSGPDEAMLRALVAENRIQQSVHFVAPSPHVRDYIAAANIAVLPSRHEGLANALLEIMVDGVPLVATRVSGTVDLVTDRVNGRLVAPENVDALAAAVVEVLRDPRDMGRRARDTVLARCEMNRVVACYLRLFSTLCQRPARTSGSALEAVCVESAE